MMSVLREKGKLVFVIAVAALVILGMGFFGGVPLARMNREHAGMISGMQSMMSGMDSSMGRHHGRSAPRDEAAQ